MTKDGAAVTATTAPAETKPLGAKAYGSIPHLPGSRLGPGDHHCAPGQASIATEKVRDKHDVVICTEKLDGSCCSVAMLPGGEIVALGRAGWLAQSSPYVQHQLFAHWVRENHTRFFRALSPGERFVGEWMAQVHGTKYSLWHEPFVIFDLIRQSAPGKRDTDGLDRAPYPELSRKVARGGFVMPALLSIGPTSIERAMSLIAGDGFHGATEAVEGAVWRVEREGRVDFLAKYVRPEKADGCYLPPKGTNGGELWNWRPS